MKVVVFDTRSYDQKYFELANTKFQFALDFQDVRLTEKTMALADGSDVACCFVNDVLNKEVLQSLKESGVKLIAMRCAGYNNIDTDAARVLNLPIVRVPEYSPYAVAEHALSLILTLNRKIHKAYNRVREANFSLEGLVGFDLHRKTIGVVGTGRIGKTFAKILIGFDCQVLLYDKIPDHDFATSVNAKYVSLEELFTNSDVISLHCPLTPETHHLIDDRQIEMMKKGAFIINTGRGALIDAKALIQGLKTGKIGAAGLDVYEEEGDLFFKDLSMKVLKDDVLARLLTFPNVLITSHQAFLTKEALGKIAETTLQNISDFNQGLPLVNKV